MSLSDLSSPTVRQPSQVGNAHSVHGSKSRARLAAFMPASSPYKTFAAVEYERSYILASSPSRSRIATGLAFGLSPNPPRPIPTPPRRLPQSKLADEVLRRAWRDAELFGDHAGAGDGMGEDEVDQRPHMRIPPPADQFPFQLLAGQQPPIMILHPGFSGGGDAVGPGDQPAGSIGGAPAFARHRPQAGVQAEKMRAGLASAAQMGADQQRAEPGAMLQRLDRLPGLPEQRASVKRRKILGLQT